MNQIQIATLPDGHTTTQLCRMIARGFEFIHPNNFTAAKE